MFPRRRFIKAAAAGLLAPRHLIAQTTAAKPYGGLPMGVHGATLTKFPVEQIIRMLTKDLQLHYLELTPSQIRLRAVAQGSNQGPAATAAEARALRTHLNDAGITPSAWGPIALTGTDTDLRQLFELASELGVPNLTAITQADHLDALEKLADEYKVRVAIHNNAPGSSFSNIADVVTALTERGANVGACLDVGNAIRASQDPAAALRTLGSKTFGVHVKSVASRDPDSDVVELGQGLLDGKTFFNALKEVKLGDKVALSLEYLAQPDDPLPGALRSLAVMQAAFQG